MLFVGLFFLWLFSSILTSTQTGNISLFRSPWIRFPIYFFFIFHFSLCFSIYMHSKCSTIPQHASLLWTYILIFFSFKFFFGFSHSCFVLRFWQLFSLNLNCYGNVWKCKANAVIVIGSHHSKYLWWSRNRLQHLIDSISNIFRFRICIHNFFGCFCCCRAATASIVSI